MLFNCLKCGKNISSKKDICPYCQVEISAFSHIHTQHQKRTLRERYKDTILSHVIR